MSLRKNIGIIMMMLGVFLTIGRIDVKNHFFKQIIELSSAYWPLLLSFIGIYLVSVPRKKKK